MRISIIGSGNVATGLGRAFYTAGHEICEIFSRSPEHAAEAALPVNARPVTLLSGLRHDVDLFLMAVKDDAIAEVAENLAGTGTAVAHTAGSVPMEVLSGCSPDYGVFYPFQTFSRSRQTDTAGTPFCLEASNRHTYELLESLAESIGGRVYRAGSVQRKALHLAGAFACNFTNHCYALAEELLKQEGLEFEIIKPLIRETTEKALLLGPREAQTGPAVRGDREVIKVHLELLKDRPAYARLYKQLSESILEMFKRVL